MKIILSAALLFGFFYAAMPMPRQAPNNGTQNGHRHEQKSGTGKQPIPPIAADSNEQGSDHEANSDKHPSVNIGVSEATQRDLLDDLSPIASIVLAIVGIFGICVCSAPC